MAPEDSEAVIDEALLDEDINIENPDSNEESLDEDLLEVEEVFELDGLKTDDLINDDEEFDNGNDPADGWSTAEKFGNTESEALEGETLDERLWQEEPDKSS